MFCWKKYAESSPKLQQDTAIFLHSSQFHSLNNIMCAYISIIITVIAITIIIIIIITTVFIAFLIAIIILLLLSLVLLFT